MQYTRHFIAISVLYLSFTISIDISVCIMHYTYNSEGNDDATTADVDDDISYLLTIKYFIFYFCKCSYKPSGSDTF